MLRSGLLAIVLLSACGKARDEATIPTASPPLKVVGADPGDRLKDEEGQLRPEATAGLYWQPYVTCDDCAVPAALVAYVAPDVSSARTVVAALDGRLGLGLPYVIHTDELRAGSGGVAVVVGAFGARADAERAAGGSDPIAGLTPTVMDIDREYWADAPKRVTVIDRGGPVPAWSQAELRAVDEALSESTDPDARATMESQQRWFSRELHQRTPACTVQPGDLFVVEDIELQLDWYRFAPVRCGGRPAYVEWTSTLLGHAVVLPDGAGGHRLRQIVGAECDSPIIDEWRYDRTGRHRLPPPDGSGDSTLALGGC